jgi:hypothetical protein
MQRDEAGDAACMSSIHSSRPAHQGVHLVGSHWELCCRSAGGEELHSLLYDAALCLLLPACLLAALNLLRHQLQRQQHTV